VAFLSFLFGRPNSSDPAAFDAFLSRWAAFVAQKTVLDYCRVKSGANEKKVFADPDFAVALEHCRWQVFLAALADIAGLAEAWLRPHCPGQEAALAARLAAWHTGALAGQDIPELERESGEAAQRAIAGHLAQLQAAPTLPAHRRPLLAEAPLFATLPIHADQRRGEALAIRGALRFHIVSAQQEMERGFDPAGLCAALLRQPAGGSAARRE
jgi:hypothetical protein